ncbi:MAG: flagellar M-ring protein FliF [Lachnospiraceae bacterium]|nr:flagellar M-ring protein FliF [Lachnospiraceae bacterium]
MVDRITNWFRTLPERFKNWWEKFTRRQKMTIVGLVIGVIIAIAILIAVVSRPDYVKIYTAKTPADAQTVIDLLNGEGIEYKTDREGLVISVDEKDYTACNLLLGSNNIYADAFSIDNVVSGGFSTTEADKNKKYVVYLEQKITDCLEYYTFVKHAKVSLSLPEDNGTLLASNKEASAAIVLELSDICTTSMAQAMGRTVATALGDYSTENIVIMDNRGSLLFSGYSDNSTYASAAGTFSLQEQKELEVESKVKSLLMGSNEYSVIEVASNIVLDISSSQYSEHLYWGDGGQGSGTQGPLVEEDHYNSQSQGGVAGRPGTDSNTETGYDYEDYQSSSTQSTEDHLEYVPNESTLYRDTPPGGIVYNQSSLSVILLTYDILREEDAKKQGLLDGITWDEYKLNNDKRVSTPVDEGIFTAVSKATGISVNDISILAYREPVFYDKEGLDIEISDILTVLLIVLIFGLLVFVIFRSMKQPKEEEEEEEISIVDILQSAPAEEQLEDIGVEDKSEARKAVEKFVEDNPDAVANLLRNWLDDEWS